MIAAQTVPEWELAYQVVADDTPAPSILAVSSAVLRETKAAILGGPGKDLVSAKDYVACTRQATQNLGIETEAARAIAEKCRASYRA